MSFRANPFFWQILASFFGILVKATCRWVEQFLLGVKHGSQFLKHWKNIWQESLGRIQKIQKEGTEWTEIVTCILLTSNQMIFRVQFGINKHSQIFQRLPIARARRASAIFLQSFKNLLELIYSKQHSKSFDYLYKH